MDMISNHLEQVALSATAIAELPFPKPKIFVNALLRSHDITALIRDTEIHERALFKAAAESDGARKSMAPGASAGEAALGSLKPGTAVGRILGSDLQRRIRRSERNKGEVDVDLLLEGAEKLVAAYPMPGVAERIQAMRVRHEKLASSIAMYEKKLADQAAEFEHLSAQPKGNAELDDDFTMQVPLESALVGGKAPAAASIEDEEAELEQLEQKRKGLEDRVNGLERDLGGLRG